MVRLSCGVQCTRAVLFVLNILFFIFGLTLLGFGIYLTVNKRLDIALSEHINTNIVGGSALEAVGIILIIVGGCTVILSAFGCLGAVFKTRAFLYLYAVMLSLLIITEMVAFVMVLSSRVSIRDSYHDALGDLFNYTYRHNHTDLQYVIEDLEHEFKCCGVDGVTDYYQQHFTVPATCHVNKDFSKPIFDQGCANAAINWLWDQFPIIGSILGGILLIEIFGVISSIALGIAISHSSYNGMY